MLLMMLLLKLLPRLHFLRRQLNKIAVSKCSNTFADLVVIAAADGVAAADAGSNPGGGMENQRTAAAAYVAVVGADVAASACAAHLERHRDGQPARELMRFSRENTI